MQTETKGRSNQVKYDFNIEQRPLRTSLLNLGCESTSFLAADGNGKHLRNLGDTSEAILETARIENWSDENDLSAGKSFCRAYRLLERVRLLPIRL